MPTIHENLKQLRRTREWTQENVAQRMGLTRQAVSSHESGRTQLDMETLKRYAEVYEVSIRDLLYGGGQSRRQCRRVRRLAALTLADLVLCTLFRSVLLWVSNRFFPIPEGQVAQEMLSVLRQHLVLSQAAENAERFSLVTLGLLSLILAVMAGRLERPPRLKTQLAYLTVLAAGAGLALLPWAVSDPVFGLVNYSLTPVLQLLWATALLLIGLLADAVRLRRDT